MTRHGAGLLLFAVACGGEPANSGRDQPIVVRGGSFKEGTVPGTPPLTSDEIADGAEPTGSHVTVVDSQNNVLRPGQVGKGLSGRATDDASSVALQLKDQGEGFWVVPLGPADPAVPGELTWSVSLDVAHDVPPGLHTLLLAALDEEGRAGTQFALPVCVRSPIPDNLHACDPSIPPPAAVVSLGWDANIDLDLLVVTPENKFVDPKHPSTSTDGELEDGDGLFDHDGLAHCELTGARRENLVFSSKPKPGVYYVFVNLFDGCGLPATRFDVSVHLAQGDPPEQVEVLHFDGEVLAAQANGGTGLGTYVTEFTIQ
ncbi:MAG: hypothetical protein HOW73_14670 [Polyangiaceae bacterium]|nr:hypothetical protein [Polyangiaceae bacterium]